MSEAKRLGFIGCGNMGEAVLRRLLESKIVASHQVNVLVRSPERLAYLESTYGVKRGNAPQDAEIIFLAVKPQQLADLPVFTVRPGTVVISMLAGTPVEKLKAYFPGASIVRTMPNLGYTVGRSVTGVYFDNSTQWQPTQQEAIRALLKTGGVTIEVTDEDKLNSITAAAGSGPAYFFWFTERIAESAKELGFNDDDAQKIAQEVFIGAAEVVKASPDITLSTWRERVASKGGTTEAALNVFNGSNVSEVTKKALKAAENRSRELSN